jgi:diacylglycerol kinase family enzyme
MGKLAAQAITRGQFDINEQPDFQHHLVDEIHLHSDSPIPYVIDGELHQGPELLIKVIPKAFLMFTHPDVVLKQQN